MTIRNGTAQLGGGTHVHEVIDGNLRCGIDRRPQLAGEPLHPADGPVTCRRCLRSAVAHAEPVSGPGTIAEAARLAARWLQIRDLRICAAVAAGRGLREVAREADLEHSTVRKMVARRTGRRDKLLSESETQ
jgi:hypothetical protein